MLKKLLLCFSIFLSSSALAEPITIVAAENFYGNLAAEIGGPYVQVTSIMQNPNQDPHLFNLNPSHAKAISQANIVIYNGLGYDTWMENLIAMHEKKNQKVINVGRLLKKNLGDNPHIWYSPAAMLTYGAALTETLKNLDPPHKKYFQQQFTQLEKNYQILKAQIQDLKLHTKNISLIATEPVFNAMAEILNIKVLGLDFQISVMNGSEPPIEQMKDFEQQLKNHTAKFLVYNEQVSSPLTDYMKKLAEKEHIPTVGVSEMQPENENYWQWMQNPLLKIKNILQN